MKMFLRGMKNIILFFCLSTAAIFAKEAQPSSMLAAYNNKIANIVYSVGSHDQCAITFFCENNPICIYTPLSLEDSQGSLTKTYFLPRTKCADAEMRYVYDDICNALKNFGIDMQVEQFRSANYGLRVTFTMESSDAYDIVKVVDSGEKTVSFNIVAKI